MINKELEDKMRAFINAIDTKGLVEAWEKENRTWHEEEWKSFIKSVQEIARKEERVKVLNEAIDLIRTHTEKNGSYCDTGEDMEWACRSDCVEMAVERLKKMLDDCK